MLVAEYNYEKDIAVKQEEARKEGREEGREEGRRRERETMVIKMIKMGKLSISEMSMCSGLSEDRIKQLQEETENN